MTILPKTFAAAVLAAVSLGTTSAFAVNLVTNGSFETGTDAPTGNPGASASASYRSLLPNSTAITAWTTFGDTVGWYHDDHPGLNAPNVVIKASQGNRFVDLTDQSGGAPFGGITTQVATVIGTKYTLTFDLGTSFFYNPVTGASAALTIGTGVPFTVVTAVTGAAQGVWVPQSVSFTAISANTQIGF